MSTVDKVAVSRCRGFDGQDCVEMKCISSVGASKNVDRPSASDGIGLFCSYTNEIGVVDFENDHQTFASHEEGHAKWVYTLEFLSEDVFVSGSSGSKIIMWKLLRKKETRSREDNEKFPLILPLNEYVTPRKSEPSPERIQNLIRIDEQRFISISSAGTAFIWTTERQKPLLGLEGSIEEILYIPEVGGVLAVEDSEKSIRLSLIDVSPKTIEQITMGYTLLPSENPKKINEDELLGKLQPRINNTGEEKRVAITFKGIHHLPQTRRFKNCVGIISKIYDGYDTYTSEYRLCLIVWDYIVGKEREKIFFPSSLRGSIKWFLIFRNYIFGGGSASVICIFDLTRKERDEDCIVLVEKLDIIEDLKKIYDVNNAPSWGNNESLENLKWAFEFQHMERSKRGTELTQRFIMNRGKRLELWQISDLNPRSCLLFQDEGFEDEKERKDYLMDNLFGCFAEDRDGKGSSFGETASNIDSIFVGFFWIRFGVSSEKLRVSKVFLM